MQKLAQSKKEQRVKIKRLNYYQNILDTTVVTKEIIEEFDKRKSPNVSKELNAVYKLVKMKDMIAEFVWLVLSGIFACTVSYNSILKTNCSKHINKLDNLHKQLRIHRKKKMMKKRVMNNLFNYYYYN